MPTASRAALPTTFYDRDPALVAREMLAFMAFTGA